LFKYSLLIWLVFVFVSGCATAPQVTVPSGVRPDSGQLASYEFAGRIALKQDEKGSSGNIRWIKSGNNTEITLVSPLGQIVAQIDSGLGGVTLTLADQRKFWAEDGETLTQQVLGYTVPVRGLNDWVLGLPASGVAAEQVLRSDGLLERLRQSGWAIQYIDYTTTGGLELPRRIVLTRDDLEIRLVIDQWTLGGPAK
jgi:outer membrane lipoprotein LolB